MLAYNIKQILELVPEAKEMIKKANIEEDFPTDCVDSVSASYLRIRYLTKVAGQNLDPDLVHKIEKSAKLYGVKDKLDTMAVKFGSIEKKASAKELEETLRLEEAMFEGELAGFGFLSLDKAAEKAEELCSQYGDMVKSAEVIRYSGKAWLNKEAAIKSLASRYHASKDSTFVKIARVVMDDIKENDFSSVKDLCTTVSKLDKEAGLDIIGFNFYKEALITKEAEFKSMYTVQLAGTSVPYEKLERFGKDRMCNTIGHDVGSALTGNPVEDKAILQSLPRDTQMMLCSVLKSV